MNRVIKFLDSTFLDLGRQFKWTYLPPLMVYMAAGISGLTIPVKPDIPAALYTINGGK